jgi:hypothetical protein
MGNRAGRSLNRRNPSSIAKPGPRLVADGAVECDVRVLVAGGGRKHNRLQPRARQPQPQPRARLLSEC